MDLRKFSLSSLVLTLGSSGPVMAASIPVPNYSFESPTTAFATPGATDWTTTGGNNAGVFQNPSSDTVISQNPLIVSRRIDNADQNQLAFIGAQGTGANGSLAGLGNSFSQTLTTTYALGQSYGFSVGIAKSSVQPPTPVTGNTIRLQLFYVDENSVDQPVGTPRIVTDAGSNILDNHLNYFSTAATPVVTANDAFLGRPIGILITTADNALTAGGFYDLDNVTLTSTPEPAGVGAAAMVFAWMTARRRRHHGLSDVSPDTRA